mgnify:CR=1 FL=1
MLKKVLGLCAVAAAMTASPLLAQEQARLVAALGTLETYADEGLLTRAGELEAYFAQAVHGLRGEPNVIDIRNMGLIGAVELDPIAGEPTKRAFSAFLAAYDKGILIRTTGDIIAMSPPLIISKAEIDRLIGTLKEVLDTLE